MMVTARCSYAHRLLQSFITHGTLHIRYAMARAKAKASGRIAPTTAANLVPTFLPVQWKPLSTMPLPLNAEGTEGSTLHIRYTMAREKAKASESIAPTSAAKLVPTSLPVTCQPLSKMSPPLNAEGMVVDIQDVLTTLRTPCTTPFTTARGMERTVTTATGAEPRALTSFLRLRIQR
jgi:hypothetical protein